MPPFDPRQIVFETSIIDHAYTIFLALLIALVGHKIQRGKILLFTLATCVVLTTPLLGICTEAVWGAYPTVDKEGSLLFYRDGVHFRLFSFSDPAHRLIGFHLGHLWITQVLDWLVGDIGAFNLHALLNVTLTWYCTYRFLHVLGAHRVWAWLLASQMGFHLHLFRDIQFYTIEKSAVYPILLYWESVIRASKGEKNAPVWMGITFFLASWINVYWGIFCALITPLLLWTYRAEHRETLGKGIGVCVVLGACVGIYQQLLTTSGPPFAYGNQFMERAALDNVSIWPLSWNRLPWYTSVSPLVIFLSGWAWHTNRFHSKYASLGIVFFILSTGPFLFQTVPNPLYQGLTALPALWRFAKPEAFFFVTFIVILSTAAKLNPSAKGCLYIGVVMLLQCCGIRMQQEYPSYFSRPIQTSLPKHWERRIFEVKGTDNSVAP